MTDVFGPVMLAGLIMALVAAVFLSVLRGRVVNVASAPKKHTEETLNSLTTVWGEALAKTRRISSMVSLVSPEAAGTST